jgi:hypothetical protein
MTVTLGSELREALDGLYGGGTTTNEGLDGLAGEETARARAASLFSDGDVERLRLSLVLSCRTPGCVLTNFEKKPGAILYLVFVVVKVVSPASCLGASSSPSQWSHPRSSAPSTPSAPMAEGNSPLPTCKTHALSRPAHSMAVNVVRYRQVQCLSLLSNVAETIPLHCFLGSSTPQTLELE